MEVLISFAINILVKFTKQYVQPKYGENGVHVLIFGLALIGALIYTFVYSIPDWKIIIENSLKILAYAIGTYEVILKKTSFNDENRVK